MPDTFTVLGQTDQPGQTCPQGQWFSAILQKCLSREDYQQAIAALAQSGNPAQAYALAQEAYQNGAGQQTNLINAVLGGDWKGIGQMILPWIIAMIGLILVFLAMSAWINSKSITLAGQTIPLPKVL